MLESEFRKAVAVNRDLVFRVAYAYLRSSSSFWTFPSYTAAPRPSTAVMAETASTAALPAVSCRESWPCLGTGRGTRFTV